MTTSRGKSWPENVPPCRRNRNFAAIPSPAACIAYPPPIVRRSAAFGETNGIRWYSQVRYPAEVRKKHRKISRKQQRFLREKSVGFVFAILCVFAFMSYLRLCIHIPGNTFLIYSDYSDYFLYVIIMFFNAGKLLFSRDRRDRIWFQKGQGGTHCRFPAIKEYQSQFGKTTGNIGLRAGLSQNWPCKRDIRDTSVLNLHFMFLILSI